jgi:hypothetical protein
LATRSATGESFGVGDVEATAAWALTGGGAA